MATGEDAGSQSEQRALGLYAEAEKKEASAGTFLGKLFGGANKLDEAVDLYTKAANAFKLAKKFTASGDSFCRAASINEKQGVKHEVAVNLVDAANVYKKSSPKDAVDCFQRVIEIYTEMGRFSIAAKHLVSLAELYETELADFEQAIAAYEQAADLYKGEDTLSGANKAMLKVAHMCAQLHQFEKGKGLFEEVGIASMENRLLQYGAKEHFFKAVICQFCVDADKAREAMEKYVELFPAFEGSREQKLLAKLLEAYSEEDEEQFTKELTDYDAISKLEPWLATQFLHIKKSIGAQGAEIN